jgi:pyruvate,orthophosphate dikinase
MQKLGLRGARLGLTVRGLFELQVRATVHAAAQRVKAGSDPKAGDHGCRSWGR